MDNVDLIQKGIEIGLGYGLIPQSLVTNKMVVVNKNKNLQSELLLVQMIESQPPQYLKYFIDSLMNS